jgi:DNA-directed RNA polymerase subunit M/transcription elongation factor TFIIS
MECKKCGNKEKFQALVTDYRPAEVWEFTGMEMTRYNQPDSGDLEIKVTCLKCDSKEVDLQGFNLEEYAGKKLETLSDEQWDAKIGA